MNYETITIQDCIDNWEKKGKSTIIKAGQVTGFIKEKDFDENMEG